MNSSHLESLIVNDDNIDCTTDILKKMNDIVVVIWNDDLNKNQTYLHLLIRLAQITKNPFPLEITSITDDYLTTEENCEFKFAFVSREKNHEVKLKKGLYLDYRFLKPIIEATEASQNNGKFYLVDDEKLDGGFCFIYLDNKEYNTIIDNGIIRVYELTTELIDEINIWVD